MKLLGRSSDGLLELWWDDASGIIKQSVICSGYYGETCYTYRFLVVNRSNDYDISPVIWCINPTGHEHNFPTGIYGGYPSMSPPLYTTDDICSFARILSSGCGFSPDIERYIVERDSPPERFVVYAKSAREIYFTITSLDDQVLFDTQWFIEAKMKWPAGQSPVQTVPTPVHPISIVETPEECQQPCETSKQVQPCQQPCELSSQVQPCQQPCELSEQQPEAKMSIFDQIVKLVADLFQVEEEKARQYVLAGIAILGLIFILWLVKKG